MLVKSGCQRADEMGLPIILQASSAAAGLYRKNGFELVEETELDLRPWGFEYTEIRCGMMRRSRGVK